MRLTPSLPGEGAGSSNSSPVVRLRVLQAKLRERMTTAMERGGGWVSDDELREAGWWSLTDDDDELMSLWQMTDEGARNVGGDLGVHLHVWSVRGVVVALEMRMRTGSSAGRLKKNEKEKLSICLSVNRVCSDEKRNLVLVVIHATNWCRLKKFYTIRFIWSSNSLLI